MPDAPVPRVRALVYDLDTGEIVNVLTRIPEDMLAAQAGAGQGVLATDEGDGGQTWYAPGGVLTLRPVAAFNKQTIAANGTDVAVLEIPGVFNVTIDGVDYEVEDSVEIASDMPATYAVQIDHFPYLAVDVEIVAS